MKIDSLCVACESIFDLASAALSPSYYYDSLPYCIIDAVFSIGVRYTSTQNVVKSYCAYYGLREYNTEQDLNGDAHTVSQMIEHIESVGIEKSADIIFKSISARHLATGFSRLTQCFDLPRYCKSMGSKHWPTWQRKQSRLKWNKKYCGYRDSKAGYLFGISICFQEMIHRRNLTAMCCGF